MKKPIAGRVIVAILVLFVAYSGFATYNWLEGETKENRTLNDAIHLFDIPLWELSDAGSVAEYLIEPDTADELVMESALRYSLQARTLYYSSSMLHTLTNDEKYRLFETTMSNLQAFFVEASTGPNGKEILTTNLDSLKQMDDIFEEILRINDLTLADAEKLLNLSANLTIG